jgi:hypothetical protein
MVFLDTNIFIYVTNQTLPPSITQKVDIAHASVARIEALGYHSITSVQERILKDIFAESNEYPLDDSLVERTIALRQNNRLKLGDAIIAATALEHNSTLWTANTKDFQHVDGLKLYNPLAKK